MFFNKQNRKKSVCTYLNNSLVFDSNNEIHLCPYKKFSKVIENYNGIWLDTDKIEKSKENIINNCSNECVNCNYYKPSNKKLGKKLECLYLANWHYCYVNCSYCDMPKEEDLIKAKHYDVMPSIQTLIDKGFVDKKTKIIFDCGDATVHPEFDKILFFLMNFGTEDIAINTPAFRYCESVAQAIANNVAEVIIPLDAGCPYIYEKIKGINKYDVAMGTIKRYLSFEEPYQIRVIFKFTIVRGINDNQKEILDWYILSRDLGLKKLLLDIDIKFFNEIKNSIPQYLKDIVIFSKNISSYNNLEIKFSPRLDIIYKSIKNQR